MAKDLVDLKRPGDFNQALMELGAIVCKPKQPSCEKCPVSEQCKAFKMMNLKKISSVEIYPKKKQKKQPKPQTIACCVIVNQEREILVSKRPPKGLLANLYEFPNIVVSEGINEDDAAESLANYFEISKKELSFCGQVTHIFSHIKQLILVYRSGVTKLKENNSYKWVTFEELNKLAFSTQMKKVFKVYEKSLMKRKRSERNSTPKKRYKQTKLEFK